MKKITLQEVRNKIFTKYPNLDIQIIDRLAGNKVLIKNKYGECIVPYPHILNGRKPTIKSAIDKNSYIINQIKELHNDNFLFDKVNYISNIDKIELFCKKHQEYFHIRPVIIKNGIGCKKCCIEIVANKSRKSKEEFIKQAINVHGDKFSYDLVEYKNNATKIKIIDNIKNTVFEVIPKDFLNGSEGFLNGYDKTKKYLKENAIGWKYDSWVNAAKKSKYFDGFKLYILRCYNNEETFYKIGKTYKKVSKRFSGKTYMPYNYDVILEIINDGLSICKLENELKNKNKSYLYVPKIKFAGMYECFYNLDAETLNIA